MWEPTMAVVTRIPRPTPICSSCSKAALSRLQGFFVSARDVLCSASVAPVSPSWYVFQAYGLGISGLIISCAF